MSRVRSRLGEVERRGESGAQGAPLAAMTRSCEEWANAEHTDKPNHTAAPESTPGTLQRRSEAASPQRVALPMVVPTPVASSQDVLDLAINGYVAEALTTLRAQLTVMGDIDWLRQHDPTGLANLHRVLTESVGRLVEAQLMVEATATPPPTRAPRS